MNVSSSSTSILMELFPFRLPPVALEADLLPSVPGLIINVITIICYTRRTKTQSSSTNPVSILVQGSIRFSVGIFDKDIWCPDTIDHMSVVWTMTPARNVSQSKWSPTQFISGTRSDDPTR